MTEKEKMVAGLCFRASDPEIRDIRNRCRRLLQKFNTLQPSLMPLGQSILGELFGHPTNAIILTPFHCEHGRFIELGDRCIINTGTVILDGAPVKIGNDCFFGPGTRISTLTHPMHMENRRRHLLYAKPITIGNNVWFGAGVVVTPGVTIGDNSIIGGGSVVTKDIPSNVVAFGSPCRVIREITESDRMPV